MINPNFFRALLFGCLVNFGVLAASRNSDAKFVAWQFNLLLLTIFVVPVVQVWGLIFFRIQKGPPLKLLIAALVITICLS